MLTGIAGMDVMDVAIQQLYILLSRIGTDIARTAALGHIECETLGGKCLVLTLVDVVVNVFDGRNLELAGMTWNSQEVVDDGALKTVGGELALVSHLGIVFVKIFGELNIGLFQQLHIAQATDDDSQFDRIVGLHLGLVNLGRNIETANTAREVGRTGRQRINIDGDARGLDLFLHLNISGTAIEESLKGVDITVLLNYDTIERNAGNLQLAGLLREHDILAPRHSLVRTAIQHLDRETLLIGKRYLASIKVLQVRHLTTQVGQSDKRVHLISQKNGLLLDDTTLRGADLDEQVATGNRRTSRTQLIGRTLRLTALAVTRLRRASPTRWL